MRNYHNAHACSYCGMPQHNNVNHAYNSYLNSINPYRYNSPYLNHFLPPAIPDSNMENQAATIKLMDYGPNPYIVDIEQATKQNTNFRTALWTGEYLQVTLMSIQPGEDIGLEVHTDHDQFIRIEDGQGLVTMGESKDNLNIQERVFDDFVIIIPAGIWHNLTNIGYKPIKLYSIYAPPEHPKGTVHKTKQIAEAYEKKQ